MRVVHIEAGRHLYGGGSQVRTLIDGLAAAGVDNVLLAPAGSELAGAPPAADVVPVPMRGELDIALLPRLARALRARRPDLVHVHSRRGADLYGGLAAALVGVPAVLTRRVDAVEPGALARLKYRPYSAIVALSTAIEAQLAAAGVERSRVLRIPSAVDTAAFRPDAAARGRLLAEFDLPADALVAGVVAQLIERKGHRLLLDALAELVQEFPALRVLCFGRGPLEATLRRGIAARGLTGVVTLAGFRGDLPRLVPGFDLLVHPAAREGLGLALLEAAAAGVPAVACAAGGVPDVVEHGVTGLLVPAGDAAALRGALARLLAAPAERATLGAAARARAERRFGVAALVAAHLSLYERVLGARAPHAVLGR
ncbi:MAG TPA: glycosyltransferase [Gammaproteobacteria bacterium]|nr:glycosyltransferase [Gammaproteobacteria bacterium]